MNGAGVPLRWRAERVVQPDLRRWKNQSGRESGMQILAELTLPLLLRGQMGWSNAVCFGTVHLLPHCCHFLCPMFSCRGRSCWSGSPDGTGKCAVRAELLSCPWWLADLSNFWLHLCLVSTLLAGPRVGWSEAENCPWKILNYQTTYVQIKLNTSNSAGGLDDDIFQKTDLFSGDVGWLSFRLHWWLNLLGAASNKNSDSGPLKFCLEAAKKHGK